MLTSRVLNHFRANQINDTGLLDFTFRFTTLFFAQGVSVNVNEICVLRHHSDINAIDLNKRFFRALQIGSLALLYRLRAIELN